MAPVGEGQQQTEQGSSGLNGSRNLGTLALVATPEAANRQRRSTSPQRATDEEASSRATVHQLPAALLGVQLGTLGANALALAAAQPNLQVLDLKDNKILNIPVEVYQTFARVRVLDLRKNLLEVLSPELVAMRTLEDLLVDQNRLQELPAEIYQLQCLKVLSLSQNRLTALPPGIDGLQALRSLSLGDNRIQELPEELGRCKDLQVLFIHHNHFTRLPTTLGQLENLTELALEWFRYTTPPLPRVIKGPEWKRIIVKFLDLCRDRREKGTARLTCIEVLAAFSQKSFDPNAIDSKRRTRLHVACLEGHVGVADALGRSGAKCDALDCEGYSPLLVAVREEHDDISTTLVRLSADVNKGGGLFGSPLHVATVNFNPGMVQLLISGRAHVNQTDADGNTPLHVLTSVFDKGGKNADAIGRILVSSGADCNTMNSDKWAPLHLAARRGQLRGTCFVVSQVAIANQLCLQGRCSHQSKSARVRTCPHVFDLNLRGGSHLWTPLHLAGHACHVPVVQILIEAAADVFIKNVDGRTPRHVSRGNLAISKLLRKAEDEWLWHRIHHEPSDARTAVEADAGVEEALDPGKKPVSGGDEQVAVSPPDEKDDQAEDEILVEELLRNIGHRPDADTEEPVRGSGVSAVPPLGPMVAPPKPVRRTPRQLANMIEQRCLDMHFTKMERQHMQIANFIIPPECTAGIEEFIPILTRAVQHGQRHRLPLLFSRPWVKELVPKLLEDPRCHDILLHPSLVCNEDFIRMLISNLPLEALPLLWSVRNQEQETWLHLLCKPPKGWTQATGCLRAEIVSLLFAVCPPGPSPLEAKDLRGQTALHMAAQCGDMSLVQVLLDARADPNAQEETTGWTPLHFAVDKAHYSVILQLLQHDAANVNQADKYDWPPLLEACSRLDARSISLLINGGANLGFRNQHHFDVLKAVDTSKKDLAAKRWMCCLLVSNGFNFQGSAVQLNQEDKATFQRERAFFESRVVPVSHPPFFVPDHLAPRCHSCKVLFSVTVRRLHCRSCGLVLCSDCLRWTSTKIVALDEKIKGRRIAAQATAFIGGVDASEATTTCFNQRRLSAAVAAALQHRPDFGGRAAPLEQQALRVGSLAPRSTSASMPQDVREAAEASVQAAPRRPGDSDDSSDSLSLPEERAPDAPPMQPARQGAAAVEASGTRWPSPPPAAQVRQEPRGMQPTRQSPHARQNSAISCSPPPSTTFRTVRFCAPCSTFFDLGVGETFAMLRCKTAV